MNDKRIINTISNIYFIMTSFLLFIFITLSVIFIVLQNGLYIENISVPSVKIKQLYIKWNESLDISVKEINVSKNTDTDDSKLELDELSKTLQKLPHLYNIIEKITIEKITIDTITASFKYEKGEDGYILAHSNNLELKSSLSFEDNLLDIKINEFSDKSRDIHIYGDIIVNTTTKDVASSLFLNIHDDISLNLRLYANEEKLYYKADSLKKIKSITYTMELLDLHPDVKYWAYEAIGFSELTINSLHGWIDFNDMGNAYKNIYASATGDDLTYKYHKNLDSIHTKKTDLEFKNGILYIYPRQAHTYKSKLGKSWIKIDFTQKEELLTLKLLFDGKLDKDTLGILEEFKIKIPFLQNSGKTKVDLTLNINLRTIAVQAQGEFFTRVANFRYHGYDIDVFNADIKLDNYDVSIKNMLAKYQDLITTDVDVVYSADTQKGIIDFRIKKIDAQLMHLDTNKQALNVQYTLTPKSDHISIDKSYWSLNGQSIEVAKMNLPFNLGTLKIKIPKTSLYAKYILHSYVSGDIDLNTLKTNLDINVKKIFFRDIELKEKNNHVKLTYAKKKLQIKTNKNIDFELNSEKSFLTPINIELINNKLTLKDTYVDIGNMFKSKLSAEYFIDKKTGYLQTRRTRFYTKELGLLYFNKDSSKFKINTDKIGTTKIISKDLEISFIDNKELWKISLDSIKLLSLNSEFLKKYSITEGSLYLSKMKNEKDIKVFTKIIYPHKIMVKNNIALEEYVLKGRFNTKTNALTGTINDNVYIKIHDTIDIEANDIGININAIIDITNSLDSSSNKVNNLQVSITAENSYLYISENRHAISDSMYLYYYNQILTAGLLYKRGSSGLKYENGTFHAYGEDFNDEFMDQLFALSDFEGGVLEFNMSGSTQKYSGILTVNNTTIIDYKVLNNILAFVNTIPTLVTFSTPGYNAKGLQLETAYMKFTSKDNVLDISDIYFHSQELDILGHGTANLKKNKIDLELNLKTDIGSSASKVPVVGYLFFDGESLSSTLSVTGPLDNPNVNTLIAKEIAVAPLNFLLRTLTLPYYLITNDGNETKEK